MRWRFQHAEDIFPTVEADDPATTTDNTPIVETPFDGCAWCGTGEGICSNCTAKIFAQSTALATTGEHRSC